MKPRYDACPVVAPLEPATALKCVSDGTSRAHVRDRGRGAAPSRCRRLVTGAPVENILRANAACSSRCGGRCGLSIKGRCRDPCPARVTYPGGGPPPVARGGWQDFAPLRGGRPGWDMHSWETVLALGSRGPQTAAKVRPVFGSAAWRQTFACPKCRARHRMLNVNLPREVLTAITDGTGEVVLGRGKGSRPASARYVKRSPDRGSARASSSHRGARQEKRATCVPRSDVRARSRPAGGGRPPRACRTPA